MKKQLITLAALAGGFVIGASALVASATGTWTAAPATPPNSNVAAPINVGSVAQEKTGSFQVDGGLGIAGGSLVYLPSGVTPVAGQVLTALNSTGLAGWANASGGGSGNGPVWFSAPVQLVPVQYGTDGSFHTISQATLSAAGVPSSAKTVILYIYGAQGQLTVRPNSASSISYGVSAEGGIQYTGAQISLPLSSSGTFDWGNTFVWGGGTPNVGINLMGYTN